MAYPNEVGPLKQSFLPLVLGIGKQGGTLFLARKKVTVTFWDRLHGWEWRAASGGWERPLLDIYQGTIDVVPQP